MKDKRTKSIRIRVSENEHLELVKKATKKGLTISTFVRILIKEN